MTTATEFGITRFGVYIPRRRLARGAIAEAHAWALPALRGMAKGARAMCSWDEDAITLAVEAARACVGTSPVGSVVLASTTAPFADLQNAVIIARALDLDRHAPCSDVSGSTRCGVSALADAAERGGASGRLVVASDRRGSKPGSAQEMAYGAGAAAFLLGHESVVARYLGRECVSVPFVDHFRESGDRHDYYWEERWIRDEGVAKLVPEAVGALLSRFELRAADVAWFGLSGVPRGSERGVAKTLGIAEDRVLGDLNGDVGDTGTPQALLQLADALERAKAGDIIVVAAFGQGCEVVAFQRTDAPLASGRSLSTALKDRIEEKSYTKMLSFDGLLQLDWGPRGENDIKAALTQQYRAADQVIGFVGGRCTQCGQVQFPRLPQCVNCFADNTQEPFRLADQEAQVATFSADWLMFYPAPPLYVGLVQFDAGARLLMEMIDVGPAGIEVGTRLRMSFRLKARDRQRHYSRYFWKAVPTA